MQTRARFVRVTNAGTDERHPHAVVLVKESPNYQDRPRKRGAIPRPCYSGPAVMTASAVETRQMQLAEASRTRASARMDAVLAPRVPG